jgi:hypothetical protein
MLRFDSVSPPNAWIATGILLAASERRVAVTVISTTPWLSSSAAGASCAYATPLPAPIIEIATSALESLSDPFT